MKDRFIDYAASFAQLEASLSQREKDLLACRTYAYESARETVERLVQLGFVRCPGGRVTLGLERGLICTIEGHRQNETPVRQIEVPSFYIAKTTVTNSEYEEFRPHHLRPGTSLGGKHPVTCVTYGGAISYCRWLNRRTGLNFCLPTEPQLYVATAPDGWMYSYQQSGAAIRRLHNVFQSYPDVYLGSEGAATLEVDDPRVPVNYLGLYHASGNVSVFTFGHFFAPGHWGAASDGAYAIAMGGNFRSCPEGARVVSRGIVDISAVPDIVGIRLVHPDPFLYVEDSGR